MRVSSEFRSMHSYFYHCFGCDTCVYIVPRLKLSLLRKSKHFEIVCAVMKVLRRFSHCPKVGEDIGSMQGAYVPVDPAIRSSITTAWDLYSRSKPLIMLAATYVHSTTALVTLLFTCWALSVGECLMCLQICLGALLYCRSIQYRSLVSFLDREIVLVTLFWMGNRLSSFQTWRGTFRNSTRVSEEFRSTL
jgi:hypothetical protein